MSNLTIREAIETDTDQIHHLLMDLAEFEKITHTVEATNESTRSALFGNRPVAESLVAITGGQIIGTAIFIHNYSTFVGRKGLHLEDIYVKPDHRGRGVGRKLLFRLAQIAEQRGCGRMEWTVLDWNSRAIEFYSEMGAQILKEWKIVRLSSEGIKKLSEKE